MRKTLTVAITVDLHAEDHPDDIRAACEELRRRGIRATFFIPSQMLEDARLRAAVQEIGRNGHEAAAHSHAHDRSEVQALMYGGSADLEFLATAKTIHEDVFGAAPTAFRSPCWCHLGAAAVRKLMALGFVADSSATPQRLGLLSSTPFSDVWSFAPRRVRYLAPGLLEVPTSTLLVPAGWQTFLVFRSRASALVDLLALECRMLQGRVLTLQFHASGFRAASPASYRGVDKLSLASFLPRRHGGFAFRARLRSGNAAEMAAVTSSLLDSLRDVRFLSVSDIAAAYREQRAQHPRRRVWSSSSAPRPF